MYRHKLAMYKVNVNRDLGNEEMRKYFPTTRHCKTIPITIRRSSVTWSILWFQPYENYHSV